MATTTRKEAMLSKLDYVIDTELRKHHIFPMKIRDIGTVTDLCSRIELEYTILNLPHQAMDEQGKPMFNEDGDAIIDDTAWDAQCQLLEMALRDTWENIETWVDIHDIQEILDAYQGLSGLKKQLAMTQRNKVLPGISL